MVLEPQGQVERGSEPIDPFACLGLTHAEEEALGRLERKDLEVEQDEQQPISGMA